MKIGGFTIVLNKLEYGRFGFNSIQNNIDMMKVVNINTKHNGEILYFVNNPIIRLDNELYNYISIIYPKLYSLDKNNKLFWYIKNNIQNCKINIDEKLYYYYVENCVNIEVFDTITDLSLLQNNIWDQDSYTKIYGFIKQILYGLKYLKKNKIGHFDIKTENIMYNQNEKLDFSKRFKLIDFGFADIYPFYNFRKRGICGTEFFIPYLVPQPYPLWALKINCNDWLKSNKQYKHISELLFYDYTIIYKTDIFAFGVCINKLLYYLTHYFTNIDTDNTFNKTEYKELYNLVNNMTNSSIKNRYSIEQCLNHTYIKNKNKNNYSLIKKIKSKLKYVCC